MLRLIYLNKLCRFSTTEALHKFKVAEKVLYTFYHHEGKEMLVDAITRQIQNMKSQDQNQKKIIHDIKNLFDPRGGMSENDFKKLMDIQPERLTLLKNKRDRISFFPHSIMMRSLMQKLYVKNEQNKLGKEASSIPDSGIHLLGTPGLCKSMSLFMIKFFHDMRIPYIIQNGEPKQTCFDQNYKIFRFRSTLDVSSIKQGILYDIKVDFKNSLLQKDVNQLKNIKDLGDFCQAAFEMYQDKKIQIKVIIDQFNQIYDELKDVRMKEKCIKNWAAVFLSVYRPMIFVSSKHIPMKMMYDPAIKIIGNDKHNFVQRVLDNQYSPSQRIAFTIQSLIFQLLKRGIQMDKAIKIVEKIDYYPMVTHLTCAKYVQKNHLALLQSIKKDTKQNPMFDLPEINNQQFQHLSNSMQSILALAKQAKLAKQGSISEDQKVTIASKIEQVKGKMPIINKIVQLDLLKIKQEVSYSLKLNNEESISGTQIVYGKNILKQKQSDFLSIPNYFFKSKLNKNQMIFSCLSPQQLEHLKMKINQTFVQEEIKEIQQFLKGIKIQFNVFKNQNKGPLFENVFNYIIEELRRRQVKTTFYLNFFSQLFLRFQGVKQKKMMPIINDKKEAQKKNNENQQIGTSTGCQNQILKSTQIDDENDKENQQIKQETETENGMISPTSEQVQHECKDKQKVQYVPNIWTDKILNQVATNLVNPSRSLYRTSKNNLSFDFTASVALKNELHLMFIDTTISEKSIRQNKIRKFKNKLLSTNNFVNLIKKCSQISPQQKLNIYYVIVNSTGTQKVIDNEKSANLLEADCCKKLREVPSIRAKLQEVKCFELVFMEGFQLMNINKDPVLAQAFKGLIKRLKNKKIVYQ